MMSEAQLLESDALRNLRQLSEARGLKFYINPPREVVPEFLGDFQPDAIAVGPEGGIVIEMKLRGSPASEQQLAAIARRVSSQRGWEFRAIYLSPPTDGTPPIAKPTPEQLQATFGEIEALMKGGHPAAALVTAWAALEALARLASGNGETRGARGFSPIQAIQALAEEGYIENEVADRLREMAKLRNAVVHGDFSVDVRAEQIEDLLQHLRTIASEIMSVTSER
ncbi:MAG TPA: HepT-like ribonuclease domain-containing protein [Acetobacteraceae bacterium]|nr:HepT-like ribonuclease domain-containing protein [Acetobacteraceae bacterium]